MSLRFLLWRQWRLRPGRTLLTGMSVALAVAAVVSSSIAASMVRRAYATLTESLEGPPALEIVSATGERVSIDQIPPIPNQEGVRTTLPMFFRLTTLFANGQRFRTLMVGLGPDAAEAWTRLELTSGRLPTESGEALLDVAVAQRLGLEVPARVTVLARRGAAPLNVVGTVSSASLRAYEGVALVVPLPTAHQVFGGKGKIDRLRIEFDSAEARDAAHAALRARLPEGLAVRVAFGRVQVADAILRSTELALQFASVLAVAMAGIIILNTLRMNFNERRPQFAVMRALGARSAQIRNLVLCEGMAFGLLGLLLGVPAGSLLALGLAQVLQQQLGGSLPMARPGAWAMVVSAGIGPLVALLSAWWVARQAQRLSPVEGMGGVEPENLERYPWRAVSLSLAAWVMAVIGLVAVIRGLLPASWALPVGVLMLMAFTLLTPVLLGPLISGVVLLLPGRLRAEALLVTRQAQRRTTRLGLTVGVLIVAISNGLGLGHAVLNNVDDVRSWYRRSMSGDYLLQPLESSNSDDVAALEPAIAAIDGVAQVETIRFRTVVAQQEPAVAMIRDFAAETQLPWPLADEAAQVRRQLGEAQLVIGSVLAQRLGVKAGETVRVELQGRAHLFPVAAVVNDYTMGGLILFLDRAAIAHLFELGPADLYVVTQQTPGPADLDARLVRFAEERRLSLQSFASLRRQFDQLIQGIVGALFLLLWVGFVVGGLGVSNTLAISVLEQTRRIGLLRIVGMTRGQVKRLVLVEGLILGLAGAILGTLAGVTTAYIIHLCNEALFARSVPFEFHAWLFAANVLGCLAVGVLAAWAPARRAAHIDLLMAASYE